MDIKFLNEERLKIWQRLTELQKLVDERAPESESTARQHAENAAVALESIKSIANEVTQLGNTLREIMPKAKDEALTVTSLYETAKEKHNQLGAFESQAIATLEALNKLNNETVEINSTINGIYSNTSHLAGKIQEIEAADEKAQDALSKIETHLKNASVRKSEIDKAYYEIFGFSETNESGVEVEVAGRIDELDDSYKQIKAQLVTYQGELGTFQQEKTEQMNAFQEKKSLEIKGLVEGWEKDVERIVERINSLLPDALTAGLSAAYSEKKAAIALESKEHAKDFQRYVGYMMLISLLPLAVSANSIFTGTAITDAILRLPRLVMAIVPIYIPALWLAYSANKKLNLSKRLIEEYSHKEVLSKTYEGLSTQITALGAHESADDLRVRLLYNILEVSSENPGKLISDYNKSDHPVMDALDKSLKLTNSVERLAKIPGLGKLANIINDKAEEALKKEAKKVEDGLESIKDKEDARES